MTDLRTLIFISTLLITPVFMGGCDGAGTGDGSPMSDGQAPDARTVLVDGGDSSTSDGESDMAGLDTGANCVAAEETCNGADDDCDGQIDEADPQMGGACDVDAVGACSEGALTCVNGALSCVQTVMPTDEVCDNIDNDCDGAMNENTSVPGCDTGGVGACAMGNQVCVNGALECRAVDGTDEICNGIDDDCDGVVDGVVCGCAGELSNVAPEAACRPDSEDPTYHVGACSETTELHIVAQFNSAGATTQVRVDRPGVPLSLVFSSYQQTQWRVVAAPGVMIRQIILNGSIAGELLDAPADVEVINRTGDMALTACAYRWPDDELGCNTPGLVMAVEQLTGLALTSFQGCYEGGMFQIGTSED